MQTTQQIPDMTEHGGRLTALNIAGYPGYLVAPLGPADQQRRWILFAPANLATHKSEEHRWSGDRSVIEHQFYAEAALAQGYHLAGVEVGLACGSPKSIEAYQALYEKLVGEFGLSARVRIVCQSNGGLMAYNWAVRHADCVDRILGIYPATDLRSWPGLAQACDPEFTRGTGYDITPEELQAQLEAWNPIEQIGSLVRSGVKVLHLHGAEDSVVPAQPNSEEFVRRYRALGGEAELVLIRNQNHTPGPPFYESRKAAEFLTQ